MDSIVRPVFTRSSRKKTLQLSLVCYRCLNASVFSTCVRKNDPRRVAEVVQSNEKAQAVGLSPKGCERIDEHRMISSCCRWTDVVLNDDEWTFWGMLRSCLTVMVAMLLFCGTLPFITTPITNWDWSFPLLLFPCLKLRMKREPAICECRMNASKLHVDELMYSTKNANSIQKFSPMLLRECLMDRMDLDCVFTPEGCLNLELCNFSTFRLSKQCLSKQCLVSSLCTGNSTKVIEILNYWRTVASCHSNMLCHNKC